MNLRKLFSRLALALAALICVPAFGADAPTRTLLFSDANPIGAGSWVMYTANVAGTLGWPTGTVAFYADGAALSGCAAVALASGGAQCVFREMVAGTRSITAVYSGDSTYAGSASPAVIQVVRVPDARAGTGGSLQFPPTTAAGQAATFILTVSGNIGTPSGLVQFRAARLPLQQGVTSITGAGAIAGCATVPLVEVSPGVGRASCTTSALEIGFHSVFATYSGDVNYVPQSFYVTDPLHWTGFHTQAVTGGTNVALASGGATASASSDAGAPLSSIAAVIDGDNAGVNWGSGGGWEDGTPDAWPDWVQIDFGGARTIERVVVHSLRDNYATPRTYWANEPFTLYGLRDFEVQGWNGSAWVALGTVTGNTLVHRTVSFEPFATDRIRVVVTRALQGKSRIVEIEAWGGPAATNATNVALARAGATAQSSSDYGPPFSSVGATIDNDRIANTWGSGGGWEDATFDAYPDWLQVTFNGAKAIDQVVVHMVRDRYWDNSQPYEGSTIHWYGVVDFTVEGWNGVSWVTLATVIDNAREKRTLGFSPFATDRIRVTVTRAQGFKSRLVEVEAWGVPADVGQTNVALARSGGIITVSSDYGGPFSSPVALNDGVATGTQWGAGGGWEDATFNAWPDWVRVDFAGAKTIDKVVIHTLQDHYPHGFEATDAMTFSLYGVTDFSVEGWGPSGWTTLATVVGNNLAKRTVTFPAFTTSNIRVNITGGLYYKSRLLEIEAWGVPAAATAAGNVALASAGATATASSDYGGPFSAVAAVNDGDVLGLDWGSGGGWEDGTFNVWLDWVQIDFAGMKTISSAVVYSLRDNYGRPTGSLETESFTLYGLVDFTVEGWNGAAWVTLATVTGNDQARRAVSFPPFATDRIRVSITSGLYFKSRIVEIEAWGS